MAPRHQRGWLKKETRSQGDTWVKVLPEPPKMSWTFKWPSLLQGDLNPGVLTTIQPKNASFEIVGFYKAD